MQRSKVATLDPAKRKAPWSVRKMECGSVWPVAGACATLLVTAFVPLVVILHGASTEIRKIDMGVARLACYSSLDRSTLIKSTKQLVPPK